MAETVESLTAHLRARAHPGHIVVWAHNSHVGDARATDMVARGELNVGQLVRETHGDQAFLVGFTTYTGTVLAANEWGGRGTRMRVQPSLTGSYGDLFHRTGIPAFLLLLRHHPALQAELGGPLLQRAIGVLYLPRTELASHYLEARLPEQFDAVIHIDETAALQQLR
jgi:erythromycin esterase-like protein